MVMLMLTMIIVKFIDTLFAKRSYGEIFHLYKLVQESMFDFQEHED